MTPDEFQDYLTKDVDAYQAVKVALETFTKYGIFEHLREWAEDVFLTRAIDPNIPQHTNGKMEGMILCQRYLQDILLPKDKKMKRVIVATYGVTENDRRTPAAGKRD